MSASSVSRNSFARATLLAGSCLLLVWFSSSSANPLHSFPNAFFPQNSSPIQAKIQTLSPNQTIRQDLKGGDTNDFQLALTADQFVQIAVEQQGSDVVVTVFRPGGEKIVELDSPNGSAGLEIVSVIADQPGNYRIQIHADPQPNGSYELRVEGPRGKTPADERRIEAEKIFWQAQQQRFNLTPKSAEDTIQTYLTALGLWRELGDARFQGYTLCNLGRVYKSIGSARLKDSLDSFVQAEAALKQAQDVSGQAFVLNEMGAAYRDLGNPQDALVPYEQALALRIAINDLRGQAQVFNNIGLIHFRTGQHYKAIENYNKALELWQRVGDKKREQTTLNNIALTSYGLGEMAQAIGGFSQVLKFSQDWGDTDLEANVRNNIGLIYHTWGDSHAALENYEAALEIFRQRYDARGEALVLENIGMLYAEFDDAQRALQHLQNAAEIRKSLDEPRGMGIVLHHIGYAQMLLGNQREALANLSLARDSSYKANDMQFVAYSLVCMGMIYVEMGKTAEALTHYQQALAIQEEVGDRRGQAITLDKIGQTYGLTDQPVKSLENYQQALKRWEEINDRQGKALTLYGIARVERKQNKLRDSGKHVAEAIDIVESLRTKITSYQLRVNYFAARQDYYELDIDTRMRLAEATGSDAEMEAALGVAERARARSLIDLLVDSHAETKGTAPQYLIDKNQHLEEEISALSEKILRLRNESLRADSPGRKNQANETSAGGKSSDVKRLEDITLMEGHSQELIRDLDENEAKIRTSNPSYSTLKQPEPLAPRQIQQLLDDDTLLLEFALGEQRSYLWAVTPAKIVAFPLPGRSEIEIAVRRLREALTAYEPPSNNEEPGHYLARLRNASPQYRERASALSQLILEPVSSQIGTKRLVIVADGALQYVPFGALPVPSVKDGQKRLTFTPLLANNEIVYQPSATALALLRKKEPRPPAGSVAILADPVFDVSDRRVQVSSGASSSSPATTALSRALRDVGDSGTPEGEFKLQRLRYSGDEADAIFAIAAPGSSLKAVGFKANRATALSPELRRFRIVHFATHGILNAEHPELSGIVLSLVDEHGEAQNGFLQLRDIYDLNLPADLVVLSACRTALGKQVRGEGLIGLTRGFMYAGASRIVASLWKVDDEATAELMKRFYIHLLKEKMPASSALRQAQLDIMGRSQWRAPYYWAGFVLQGEWK